MRLLTAVISLFSLALFSISARNLFMEPFYLLTYSGKGLYLMGSWSCRKLYDTLRFHVTDCFQCKSFASKKEPWNVSLSFFFVIMINAWIYAYFSSLYEHDSRETMLICARMFPDVKPWEVMKICRQSKVHSLESSAADFLYYTEQLMRWRAEVGNTK